MSDRWRNKDFEAVRIGDDIHFHCTVSGCRSYHLSHSYGDSGVFGCPVHEVGQAVNMLRTRLGATIICSSPSLLVRGNRTDLQLYVGALSTGLIFWECAVKNAGPWNRLNLYNATYKAVHAKVALDKRASALYDARLRAAAINNLKEPLPGMSLVDYIRGVEVP